MAKWTTYINARLDGASDEDANGMAGYRGQTPGRVIRLYVRVARLREQWNAWGAGGGVQSVRADHEATRQRIREVEARLREYQAELDDLNDYKRTLDVFLAWKDGQESSRPGDDSG